MKTIALVVVTVMGWSEPGRDALPTSVPTGTAQATAALSAEIVEQSLPFTAGTDEIAALVARQSETNDVHRAARNFRIAAYAAFRHDRAAYDAHRKAGDELLARWTKSGEPREHRAEVAEWFRTASQGALPPLPEFVGRKWVSQGDQPLGLETSELRIFPAGPLPDGVGDAEPGLSPKEKASLLDSLIKGFEGALDATEAETDATDVEQSTAKSDLPPAAAPAPAEDGEPQEGPQL